ncbi:MAG: 3-dehydroquinate synthase family protein, partial [Proteocatella sp.]
MNRIEINARSGVSEIYLNNGIFKNAAEICIEKFNMNKIHIITDDNIENIYLDGLISDFAQLVYSDLDPEDAQADFDFEISYSIIPAGEDSKNLGTVADIYESLADAEISRNDLIIALGGGVVGDIAGFAAATYLRGVKLCQIPTTLLSQVDSSVGGKCGINLPQGKNMVGSFYQPSLVIIDPQLLSTLSEEAFSDGMAEVIKYGFINKP